MEIRLQLILTTCIVNFELIPFQLCSQATSQTVISKGNHESKIQENFRNLFDSISDSDGKKSKSYREILMEEVSRDRQAFDAMKEELQVARSKRIRNSYEQSYNGNVVAVKREMNESSIFDSGTFPPHSVADYRIPLQHEYLRSAKNPEVAMMHYFNKLDIDYPEKDLLDFVVHDTPLFQKWSDEFLVHQLHVRNLYACALAKTRVSDMEFEFHDAVTDAGKTACYNQCLSENEQFYKFLSSKLQNLIYKNPLVDIALSPPSGFSGQEEISECTRVAEKKYQCDCFYKNYLVKVSPEFELLFGRIILESTEMTSLFESRKELEERYGIPMKLVGFLILYHLVPDDMLTYLAWWTNSEGETNS